MRRDNARKTKPVSGLTQLACAILAALLAFAPTLAAQINSTPSESESALASLRLEEEALLRDSGLHRDWTPLTVILSATPLALVLRDTGASDADSSPSLPNSSRLFARAPPSAC